MHLFAMSSIKGTCQRTVHMQRLLTMLLAAAVWSHDAVVTHTNDDGTHHHHKKDHDDDNSGAVWVWSLLILMILFSLVWAPFSIR